MLKSTHLLCLVLVSNVVFSQADTIRLKNPSFEDTPKRGGNAMDGIIGWFDCGKINFPQESPPDIHPNGFWGNDSPAIDKDTYLGMVVRDNQTYESISTRLDTVLEANEVYSLSFYLSKAKIYRSMSRLTEEEADFLTPTIFRIWGGRGYCNEKELLYESPPIDHNNWKLYNIKIKPKYSYKSLTLSAYYDKNLDHPYNGHILVDGISDIIRVK